MYYNPYGAYPQPMSVIRVNGENGAKALQLAPNSSALVLDETAPIVWLCQSDGAGYKTAKPYKIEPMEAATPESLEKRLARLEERCESYFERFGLQSADGARQSVERIPVRAESSGSGQRDDRTKSHAEADRR